MSDKKMLRAIINGQSVLKQDLMKEMGKVRVEIKDVKKEVGKIEKNLTTRMDALGKQLNVLDEDAPTRDEFDGLEERVVNLEQTSSN